MYFRYVWQHRIAIVAAAVACAAAGLAVAKLRPPEYLAAVTLKVSPEPDPTTAEIIAALRSTETAQKALEGLGCEDATSDPATFVREHVEIQAVPSSPLLRLHITGSDASGVVQVANAVAQTALAALDSRVRHSRSTLMTVLDRRLTRASGRLQELSLELARRRGPGRRGGGALSPEVSRLELEYAAAARSYSDVAQEREFLLVAAEDDHHVFDIIEPARAPPERTSASTAQVLMFAAVAGWVTAVLAVAVVAYVRTTSEVADYHTLV